MAKNEKKVSSKKKSEKTVKVNGRKRTIEANGKSKQRNATEAAIKKRTDEDKANFLKTYEKKAGNVSATATACNITRRTFYHWMETDEDFANKIKDVNESLLDFAESKLLEKVNEGDLTAVIFMLKTKGKERGYVERVENQVKVSPFLEMMKSLPDDPENE